MSANKPIVEKIRGLGLIDTDRLGICEMQSQSYAGAGQILITSNRD